MKTLMLMRHAKSSWDDESLPDFERPLNERGKRDALRIGRELLAREAVPDVIISSTAVRAMETTLLVGEGLAGGTGTGAGTGVGDRAIDRDVPADLIEREPLLYGAPPDRILEIVNLVPDTCSCALIVGHNPGMQDLVTSLIGEWLPDGMKTATVACIQFDVAEWSHADETSGNLLWMLYPGQLSKDE